MELMQFHQKYYYHSVHFKVPPPHTCFSSGGLEVAVQC
ncbi:hypothetical protein Z043_120363 [Scleropages formosus]|uniref:Uncharacterized protein n=1 Tax=Scleropages formosus TaxID=113540 RepID=A0A0P7TKV5_SCLFO|nr:hypothetical protein Z043_120363 [Scleropages formosus]